MDLISSQNHSKSNNSFGLIDENLMNNISLGGGFGVGGGNSSGTADESGSSQKFRIKDKPPIPAKKTPTQKQPFGNILNSQVPTYPSQFHQVKFSQQFVENDNFNTYDEQIGDATVESVKFNDEDLAELEFSNSETEDDDEDEEEEENDENKENNFTTVNNKDLLEPKRVELENSLFENIPKLQKHNFENNRKNIIDDTNKEQNDLFNESADILMKSQRFASEKVETNPKDNLKAEDNFLLNLNNANESINKQNNETDISFYNTSQNITQNERINQLVMQSVERFKRFSKNVEADLYNTSLTSHLNQNLVKPRFSSSSIQTVKSNLNNNLKSLNNNDNQNENEITTTAANLTNMDSSLLLKTSFNPDILNIDHQSPAFKENKFLDSKYFNFKNQEDLFEEPSFLNNKNNNPVIKLNGNQIETSQNNIQPNMFNDEFDPTNQANLLGDLNEMDFKPSSEVMDMFDKDEYENKKEFELSVAINDKSTTSATNSSGPSSTSSTSSGCNNEKWWNNLNAQQVSKLELSNISYLSNTLNDNNVNTTPSISKLNQQKKATIINNNNNTNKHKIDVGDYFTRKSDMPEFLAQKIDKEDKSEETTHDNTIVNETETENLSAKQIMPAVNDKSKHLESISENSITFSSPSNFNSLAAGSNFSFTLNATGDFIEDLKNKASSSSKSTTTPFQLTKMLQKQQQSKSTNLKAIAEDLNRVSNRLANTNLTSEDVIDDESETTKNETATTLMIPPNQKIISNPLLSSSIKSSISNSNLKILLNMDETVSSISSANIASKKSNDSSTSGGNNKQTGSLTSTPSKRNNKSNNLHVIDKSSAQDSFISSIPERNDSTLVGNHHQQPIYSKNHHRHHKYSSSTSNLNTKSKKQKNAEIQTSPSSNVNNQDDLNKNSRISLSSVSNSTNNSNESTANLLATQITAFNNLAASLSQNNTSTNSVASTQMVPFTFLPAGVVMKYLEEMQTSLKSNYENISKLSANNQTESNSKLFSDTNNATPISSADSTLTTITATKTNTSKCINNIAIPIVELDKNSIDFGPIAEGCNNTLRMVVKLTQDSFKTIMEQKRELNYTSYLQIEYDYSNDWTIEPFDLKTNKIITSTNSLLKKKLNDNYIRSKFIQTLTLHNDKSTINNKTTSNMTSYNNPDELNSILKFDFISNYYEFFVNLNTNELNFYKEMIQKLTDQLSSQLDPILIKTNIYIYYCVKQYDNNILTQNMMKKYLLNRIDLKYVLGYSRLRTAANIDSIEFELNNLSFQKEEEDINDKTLLHEKTLSSINDLNCASNDLNRTLNLDKFVPLTNAGNINIDVSCFMSNNDFVNRQKLTFRNYELRLNDPLISLEAQSKLKGYAQLNLIKLYNSNSLNNDDSDMITAMINNSNARLIVQVKPNGLIHEIPIRVKTSSDLNAIIPQNPKENEVIKLEKPTSNNITADAKIASSKTIYFFSKCLNKPNNASGLEDEITLKNINNYDVKCCMTILNTSYFKFWNDATKLNKNSIKLNDQMNEIQFSLNSQQQISIKVNFDYSSFPHPDFNSLVVSAIAKLKVNGSNKSYRFNLIGFMINESMLNIENAIIINELTSSTKIDECLNSRQIKFFKYNIDMMNTNYQSHRLIYRKVLNIDTKTFNTKCLLYPFIYDSRTNRQIPNNSKNSNDLCYDLNMDNSGGRLRLILNDLQVNKLNDLEWIEFKPDQNYQINLEFILNETSSTQNLYSKLDWLQIGLFWIEHDINAYCAQNVKRIGSNSIISTNNNMIDSILNKLLTNLSLINSNNINLNDSIASSKSSHLSFNNDDAMSISSNLNESKAKTNNRDEPLSYLKLLRQSLKCSILKLRLKPVLIDNNLNVTNKLPDLLFSKQTGDNNINLDISKNETISKTPESWSIKPDVLIIDKNDLLINKVHKLELKNNLLRKPLGFDIKSNKYLNIHPITGILEPTEKIQISVEPKKSSINNLPWSGTIIICCNKVQREVRVTIASENDISTVEIKRENNTLLNNISTFSMGQVSSSSTPYNHSSSAPTILSSKSTTLEQGTLGQTDITQYTITHDSIPMTPLLNTSLACNEIDSIKESKAPPTPAVKIYKTGTDSRVEFPPLTMGKQITCQLVMTNPTNSNVNWNAYSTGPVLVGPNRIQMKPGLNIFTVSPSSGVIQPLQKLCFNIVFTPKEINGEFTQTWQVDTRISETNQTEKSKDDSLIYGLAPFNCQLIITGKCIGQSDENFNKYKLSDRILKSKLSSTGDLASSILNKNHVSNTSKLTSLIKNKENSSASINTILTDKSYNSNAISNVSSSMLSITSNSSTTSRSNRLILKNEQIDFVDTLPNQVSKGFLTIHNREDFDCKIRILTLNDPFYCKYTDMRVNSKHYVKVPVEFKPKCLGDFSQRMLVKVEEYEMPLSSILKGKCVNKI
jgi:hypothetical protein